MITQSNTTSFPTASLMSLACSLIARIVLSTASVSSKDSRSHFGSFCRAKNRVLDSFDIEMKEGRDEDNEQRWSGRAGREKLTKAWARELMRSPTFSKNNASWWVAVKARLEGKEPDVSSNA